MQRGRRKKAQLTMWEFTKKSSNPSHKATESSRSNPKRSNDKMEPLPRPTIPPFFRDIPSTPKKSPPIGSLADDAWEVAERIANGQKLTHPVSYGDEGKAVEESESDFEEDNVRHRVAEERPSLRRKHSASGLRDDRVSMTKRSGNKNAKRRTPIKFATQCSAVIVDGGDSNDGNPNGTRREIVNEHEVVFLDGEKSEMSGTDNEDADVSRCPEPVRHSGTRRRISLTESAITPTNKNETDCGKSEDFQTPEEFSLHGQGLGSHCQIVKAPKKVKRTSSDDGEDSIPKKAAVISRRAVAAVSTRKRARELVSMFESDDSVQPETSPLNGKKRPVRRRVPDSDDSELDNSDGDDVLKAKSARTPPSSKKRMKLRQGPDSADSESDNSDGDKLPKATSVRRSGLFEENDKVVTTPTVKRSENHGGSSGNVRKRSMFVSGDEENTVTRMQNSTPISVEEDEAPHNSPPERKVKIGLCPGKSTTRRATATRNVTKEGKGTSKAGAVIASKSYKTWQRNSLQLTATPTSAKNTVTDTKEIDSGSPSRGGNPEIINVTSSDDESDKNSSAGNEGESSDEEEDGDGQAENRILTRSAARRASQYRKSSESPSFELGEVSDDSLGSSGSNSPVEVIPDEAEDDEGVSRVRQCTPERKKRKGKVLFSASNSGRRNVSITPESTPSPPSTKKRRRLRKLATKDSDDEEEDWARAQLFDTAQQIPLTHSAEKGMNQGTSSKSGEWYYEREIAQFSSSDSRDFQAIPSTDREASGSALRRARRRRRIAKISKPSPVRRLILQSNSDQDGNENVDEKLVETGEVLDIEAMSIGDIPDYEAPERDMIQSIDEYDKVANDRQEGKCSGGLLKATRHAKKQRVGECKEVIDLIDVEGGIDAVVVAPESDSPMQVDEIQNSSSPQESSAHQDLGNECISVEDDDKPPPFNLLVLCNPGESIRQMTDRLGENTILDKILEAQNDGREILGGEELGITQSFNRNVFTHFSETVVADHIGKHEKITNVTELALRGEYKFTYRGKGSENTRGRGGKGGKNRYRGKRGGRRGGSSSAGGKGRGTGRLANLRNRKA